MLSRDVNLFVLSILLCGCAGDALPQPPKQAQPVSKSAAPKSVSIRDIVGEWTGNDSNGTSIQLTIQNDSSYVLRCTRGTWVNLNGGPIRQAQGGPFEFHTQQGHTRIEKWEVKLSEDGVTLNVSGLLVEQVGLTENEIPVATRLSRAK